MTSFRSWARVKAAAEEALETDDDDDDMPLSERLSGVSHDDNEYPLAPTLLDLDRGSDFTLRRVFFLGGRLEKCDRIRLLIASSNSGLSLYALPSAAQNPAS